MIIKSKKDIPWHKITDEKHFLNRRQFIQQAALGSAALSAASLLPFSLAHAASRPVPPFLSTKLAGRTPGPYATTEELTPYEDVTRYNNFYEFGTDKGDPVEYAQNFRTDPWSVKIEGLVEKPGTYTLEDILKPHTLEDRIYRMRCVEAWSMVVPWVGFPLADLIKRFQPTSKARYVEFTTLHDPKQMPGQASRFSTIDWPYVEGLRMDEAMHPLTILAVGVYGKAMPPQNGAPIRLVVPWKYGFKSIKSIVSIRFRETKPYTTWNLLAPREYGFYANVNPTVDHPRWSQKIERRLPSSLFNRNTRKTLMFNGYAEEVAHLYSDLDLKRFY